MRPDSQTRYAAAITLSKSKMFEYRVPEGDHIDLPRGLNLEMQFPLSIGTIGDFAAEIVSQVVGQNLEQQTPRDEVIFSAQVLQAFDEALLNGSLSSTVRLLAAAGYYLGDAPGNSAVLASRPLESTNSADDELSASVWAALDKPWSRDSSSLRDEPLARILSALIAHFKSGTLPNDAISAIRDLQEWAYSSGTAHELLMADLLSAVTVRRIRNSAWSLLPGYSDLPRELWAPFLLREGAIKEIWPSQRMLGNAGLYRGQSGIVQMPTSAGKSKATELIIRSAFLSSRTKLALVVAPFRALCQEIANDLEKAFREDNYDVNQLTDALQADIDIEIFDVKITSRPQVVVLTPEKLLYVLRQDASIVSKAGLLVYDEGHQFDTGTRGVTYELLLTSILRLLPGDAQTILISAVIQNAEAVAAWLLRDRTKVVIDQSMQTRRHIAFASLPHGKDGQLQFNAASDTEQKFFVPRVIVPEKLQRRPGERSDRYFPTDASGSIALYLALRLIDNGGIAIYAGKKNSAAKIVRDAVEEAFGRGVSLPSPAKRSDPEEIRRFKNLYEINFGAESYLTKAAGLGIFIHTGNTPHGVRLAIEYAMRNRLIWLVVCTSTLAQGVNLPIRYLLVTSPMQGRDDFKPRDFHNLMGRAGRSGMYGEGTVIFTDPRLFDERASNPERWEKTAHLVRPGSAAPTGSSLLSLFDPLWNEPHTTSLSRPTPIEIAKAIVDRWEELYSALGNISADLKRSKFSAKSLQEQLESKKRIVEAIESFLMTYRGNEETSAFVENASQLASETLAYSIGNDDQKGLLKEIFESVARRIDRLIPNSAAQQRFGRTLLGIDKALRIDEWVSENFFQLATVDSDNDLFDLLWPLLVELTPEKRLKDTMPETAIKGLADGWLKGSHFTELLAALDATKATYPWGKGRREFDVDMVVELCEQAFGFDFALLIAAIKESVTADLSEELSEPFKAIADTLQKRLKYGLRTKECIAYFEAGFSERAVAQALYINLFDEPTSIYDVRRIATEYLDEIRSVLSDFPAYFSDVLQNLVASK